MTRTRLILVAVALLIISIIGNAFLGYENYSSASDAIGGVQTANHRIGGLVRKTHRLSVATQHELANQKRLTAEHRAQNKRQLAQLKAQTAANHRLTVRLGQLAAQRNADNAAAIAQEAALSAANQRNLAGLASDQSRITVLQAQQHHATLQAQYDTCIAVERLKKAERFTLVTIFAPIKLTPAQHAELVKLEAQFNPTACHKP